MATASQAQNQLIRSLIPARIDRLGWSKFHTRMVIALGVAWILDGLEITIASNLTAALGISGAGRRGGALPQNPGS